MPEIRKEVKAARLDYACDTLRCTGVARLNPEVAVILTNPIIYPHKCTVCHRTYKFSRVYPDLEVVD